MRGCDFIKYSKLSYPEKWILIGIPTLFILGSCFHLLYDLSNKSPLIGTISAVNESVWEHGKMILLPIILWWTIYYIAKGKKYSINKNKWFTGLLIALVSALFTSPLFFYFYTEAFGKEVLIIDIAILLLAYAVGQCLGLHFYRYSKGLNSYISIALVIIIFTVFIVFTFYPPHLPLFQDSKTGDYGI